MKIILGSKSPRRKEILSLMGYDYQVRVSEAEEVTDKTNPKDVVASIAKQKANNIPVKDDELLICADTIVALDDLILGKPKDKDDAYRMLRMLSGRKHKVYTGYAIFNNRKIVNKMVESEVLFNDLSDQFIWDYIATGSPMDKAGAYGFQDKDFPVVKQVVGSIENVIGFPTAEIKKDLESL